MKEPKEIWIYTLDDDGTYPESLGVWTAWHEKKNMATDIKYIRFDIAAEKDNRIAEFIIDEGVDDIAIRELALKVLSNEDVDGDTYGVPDIVTIVEMLVRRIRVLERAWEMYDEDRLLGTSPPDDFIKRAEAELEQADGKV